MSRFAGRGSKDLVLRPFVQIFVSFLVLIVIAFLGLTFQYTFMTWFPQVIKDIFHYLRNRIFWNLPMRILLQQYVIITISALLNIRFRNKDDNTQNLVSKHFSGLIVAFYSLFAPILIIVLLWKYNYKYAETVFSKKFDSVALKIYTNKKTSAIMTGVSLLRMLCLIGLAVGSDWNLLQYGSAVYIQEVYCIYLLATAPYLDLKRNRIEYFNEVLMLYMLLLMATFTDYVPSPKIRYEYIGWLMIYVLYT